MSRPFQLYSIPPISVEIKFGKKSGNRPMMLEHFLVVERTKDSSQNFNVCEDVHASPLIGDKPMKIPITFMSDDIEENFALFRGAFDNKGLMSCGAKYGEPTAKRWVDGSSRLSTPKDVECNDQCPIWNSDKVYPSFGKCSIFGTLYFRLHDSIPRAGEFGVLRIKGTYAKKYLQSSLAILAAQTGGILANLPLAVRIHFEKKRASDGQYYRTPMISIEPAEGPAKFMETVMREWENRAKLYQLRNGGKTHTDQEDLMIKGVLGAVSTREILHSEDSPIGDDVGGDEEGADNAPKLSPAIEAVLNEMPARKAESMRRSIEGLGEEEALRLLEG